MVKGLKQFCWWYAARFLYLGIYGDKKGKRSVWDSVLFEIVCVMRPTKCIAKNRCPLIELLINFCWDASHQKLNTAEIGPWNQCLEALDSDTSFHLQNRFLSVNGNLWNGFSSKKKLKWGMTCYSIWLEIPSFTENFLSINFRKQYQLKKTQKWW